MEEALGPFHVPQHSRRVKLRITPPATDPNIELHSYLFSAADSPDQHLRSSSNSNASHGGEVIPMSAPALSSDAGIPTSICGALNLSLATHGRAVQQLSVSQRSGRSAAPVTVTTTPVGPFTGYASILTRSRFLRPAEELLEDFCGENRGGVSELAAEKVRVLVASVGENWSQKVADRRCSDSNLLSMLHEVYKRYKLYHQQMQSAVSSFESVAGLANAAPFISFAIKAVSKHFHCLKKAILDYIDFTNPGCIRNDYRNGGDSSGYVSSHHHDQRPHQQLQCYGSIHHPVWRSQRGFPEKAVVVLRRWLFENFLHPYPTDTDKEMLARRTGLSRSQVSNWFTNARVRLWKPMVEEIHTLEKQSHFPSESEHRKFVNVLADHFSSVNPHPPDKGSSVDWFPRLLENESRHNSQAVSRAGGGQVSQMQPQPDLYLAGRGKNEGDKHNGSSGYGAVGEGAVGLTWSNCGHTVPFWLAK